MKDGIEGTIISLLLSFGSMFTSLNYVALSFPLKLLKEVCDLYEVLQTSAKNENILGKRAKRHPVVKYFTWLRYITEGGRDSERLQSVLGGQYAPDNLSHGSPIITASHNH